MQLLPHDEERTWLIDRLAELVARRGIEPWLANPIVEPNSTFFPDHWSSSFEGADRVARRLMQYAGLGGYDVEITTFEETDVDLEELESQTSRHGTAGLFLGLEDGVCRIALATDLVTDAETIAGVLSHEVAHAYRVAHGLEGAASREVEELLTDLTAVFLGFGLLQANNSSRSRSATRQLGGQIQHSWRVEKFGYLSGQAFAYLLALQLATRGAGGRTRRQLRSLLEPNLAEFLDAATPVIEEDLPQLISRLQVPPEGARPAVTDPAELCSPLPEYRLPQGLSTAPPPEHRGWPVFRIRENRATAGAWLGVFAGVFLTGLGLAFGVFDAFEQTLGLVLFGSVPVGATLLGHWAGRRRVRDLCSAHDCKHEIPSGRSHCPTCGGEILGVLEDPNDRLRAEEEILAGRRRAGLPVPEPVGGRLARASEVPMDGREEFNL